MRLLWDNKLIDVTITPDVESIEYPSSNLVDPRLSRFYKTNDDANQSIVFSGTSVKASYIAIAGHNFSSGAQITLQGNTEDVWIDPDFEKEITWRAGIIVHDFTESEYAYWRLVVDDSNSDGYLRIGYVYLGTYLQMPGMEIGQDIDDDAGDGYLARNLKISHPRVTHEQRAAIREAFNSCRVGNISFSTSGQFYADGRVRPVIVLMWAHDLESEEPVYAIFGDDKLQWKRTDDPGLPWKITIEYREVF